MYDVDGNGSIDLQVSNMRIRRNSAARGAVVFVAALQASLAEDLHP